MGPTVSLRKGRSPQRRAPEVENPLGGGGNVASKGGAHERASSVCAFASGLAAVICAPPGAASAQSNPSPRVIGANEGVVGKGAMASMPTSRSARFPPAPRSCTLPRASCRPALRRRLTCTRLTRRFSTSSRARSLSCSVMKYIPSEPAARRSSLLVPGCRSGTNQPSLPASWASCPAGKSRGASGRSACRRITPAMQLCASRTLQHARHSWAKPSPGTRGTDLADRPGA